MGKPHTTHGFLPIRCVKCARLLLYGLFAGVLRCPSCKQDNIVPLDKFLESLHNSACTTQYEPIEAP